MRIARTTLVRGGLLAALVGVELYLARSMTSAPSIRGYVETRSFSVASGQKGVVRKIYVSLGQQVTAGEVIAELGGGTLDAELSVALAERRRVLAAGGDDEALRLVDRRLELLAEKRDALRLKAPADGRIESIDARTGDAVGPETTIASLVAGDPRRVVACVPEARAGEVAIGSTAEVTSLVGGAQLHGVVESITPAVAELPPRCQPVVAKPPQVGRIAIVALDGSASLLPGQSELIAFGPPAATLPAAARSEVPAAAPIAIDVPPALAAISRVEASGLVWIPSRDRYLVVSDETGTGDRHPPWLFEMSARGVLDPEPLVVENVSMLDDIESIADDGKGGLWLLASQSRSEKGKRPPARELLAHLVPEGAGYRADRQVQLASSLAASGVAARLGVDLDRLDIEGMAYRAGALYLGLKAPLDAQGRATIWKIAAPDKLLDGDAAGAGIAVWSTVALPVTVDGKPVPGGIADLVFVSDTTLAVGATAPGAHHQDGAVYVIANGRATRLQSFRDLKPEGVALSATAGQLVIVFDRGRDVPLWTELALPQPPDL
ncbi:MAG TPA: HlyD family efflux transporter periplasmic adaptor subunit [Kofleriaceae bacterium]|nr:HlyD family efflux transporter periplasmic adaptor subunit [Kofleriaceae bacterium]